MPSIRVLVADDSALVRQTLTRALAMDPRITVVGTARTGAEAVDLARTASPDVIALGLDMPEMSGLEALPLILSCCEARVVMLSPVDDPETTYRALSLGAVDFMLRPRVGVAASMTELTDVLLKKIKTAYRASLRSAAERRVASSEGGRVSPTARAVAAPAGACVAVAASTGGPPALEQFIAGLPADVAAPVVVTQHLPAGFTESLARRLTSVSDLTVVEAADRMRLRHGHVYLAPYGTHLHVRRAGDIAVAQLRDGPTIHGVRPAADPMFESVARAFGGGAVGVVLTGMGRDGAAGSLAIREAGGEVIVQDEASSVIWGMPGATVAAKAATRVVPIAFVATEVRRAVRLRALPPGD